VTFADSVLHLIRAGARIDPPARQAAGDSTDALSSLPTGVPVEDTARSNATAAKSHAVEEAISEGVELAAEADGAVHEYEPGMADLEAAVGLVSAGLATRVILAGFPSWPGLLWRAYQLADTTDVLILPTVVRPGGKVDIVIVRDSAPDV
jgi:hypothetical protein